MSEQELDHVVIRFSGDSGDGMQLTGTQFSNTSALMGNDLATFPDYPSEIRAPQGTVAGVSGFQINIGSTEILTPGDQPDMLVAMNPAALKANLGILREGGTILVNGESFDEKGLKKAGYTETPLGTPGLEKFKVISVPMDSLLLEALKDIELDSKSKLRCKNFFALGMTYYMYNRTSDATLEWIDTKFGKKLPLVAEANKLALKTGFNYADNTHATAAQFKIAPASITAGTYRQINGNQATAWGLMQAAESADLPLFLGSYPITPATDILHELSKFKHHGVKTFQAEDEIAGICTAIGASFGGALATTTTSGPGVALKGEAMGLAVIMELPLVVVNVQRGGPSTGLPTKTEQSDLLQAMYGRNGESPMPIVAASRPSDCYEMAYHAAKIALEHMTPVMLLTDGYIANGAEPWRIPDNLKEAFPTIKHKRITTAKTDGEAFQVYKRDEDLVRDWAIPGVPGYEHRVGGLEKDELTGNVSHDPINHEKMTHTRQAKVDKIADFIPKQEVEGEMTGDVLVLSWGGTYGSTHSAVKAMQKDGKKVSLAHMRFIYPMPSNMNEIFKGFKKIFIPELNNGQLKFLVDANFDVPTFGYHKIQGLYFTVSELVTAINREIETL